MRSNSNIRLCLFQYYYELVDYYDWIKDKVNFYFIILPSGFHPDIKSINPLVHMLTSLRYVRKSKPPTPSVTLRHIFAYTPLPSKRYVTFERPLTYRY